MPARIAAAAPLHQIPIGIDRCRNGIGGRPTVSPLCGRADGARAGCGAARARSTR
ncbi:hypothetical protein BF49_0479 [Bradyrhizobium sp.]|nr:hypothetical protein BF49_0479 [Bradyrhizobium sp.]